MKKPNFRKWLTSREHSGIIRPSILGSRSWMGVLNLWVLQWLFIRLAYVEDVVTGEFIEWKIIKTAPLTMWRKR